MLPSRLPSESNPREFLKAFLMDRWEPLLFEEEALRHRQETIRDLLDAFHGIPAPGEDCPKDSSVEGIVVPLAKEAEKLLQGTHLPESEEIFDRALEALMSDVQLDRGDAKKWPHITSEDKAVRALTKYLTASPHRRTLEKTFREFNTARHWSLSRSFLEQGNINKAEESIVWSQQEIRHVIAISLGIDLSQLREDAETESQTGGRPEREVTLGLFEKYLLPESEAFRRASRALIPFLKRFPVEGFVRPIRDFNFKPKQTTGLRTAAELLSALKAQNENLTLVLAPDARIDLERVLHAALHLPEASGHCYFRMPDIDPFKNVRIEDDRGRLLVHFDDRGRLADAPSLQAFRTERPDEQDPLDVAVLGGGPGGIAAAVALTCLGVLRYTVFERTEPDSTVRDIWSREKEADTFYSGRPDPTEGPVGMQDTTRAVFLNRMNTFIDYFHLNLHRREPVTELSGGKNGLWILRTPQGTYQARNVIMTAGRYGKPKLLKWEEGELSKELRTRIVRGVEVDNIENSTVLVIGGGNTAFDNVRTLTDQGTGGKGNRVFLSYYRKPFNVPGSLHVHNNDQFLQWESEGKLTILWNTNTVAVEAAEGRWKVLFKEPESPPLVVDYIAPAVGWQIDKEMMEGLGVHFVEGKNPDCDPETLQAFTRTADGRRESIPGLHIAGDYYLQRSVPAAFTTNYRAAVAVSKRLRTGL